MQKKKVGCGRLEGDGGRTRQLIVEYGGIRVQDRYSGHVIRGRRRAGRFTGSVKRTCGDGDRRNDLGEREPVGQSARPS